MDLLVRRYSKWIYAKLEMLHILICWMLLRWYSHFTSNNIGDIAHDQTWGHALDLRHSFFWTNPKNDHDVMQLSSKRKPNMTGGWIWPALQNHNLVAWFQPPDVKHSIIDPNQDWNSIKKNHQLWPGFSEKTPQNPSADHHGIPLIGHKIRVRPPLLTKPHGVLLHPKI
jgi:hypothetical protein